MENNRTMKFTSLTRTKLFQLRKIKGAIYFFFFSLIGITMLYELTNPLISVSTVTRNISQAYPAEILAMAFLACGFFSVYSGAFHKKWYLVTFVPMYIYTIATVEAYLNNSVPFIALVFYLFICSLTLYDLFEHKGKDK